MEAVKQVQDMNNSLLEVTVQPKTRRILDGQVVKTKSGRSEKAKI